MSDTIADELNGIDLGDERLNKRSKHLLEALNLTDKANAKPKNLSVGEQQRVSIARALLHQPKILFADEPTSALDDTNTAQVVSLLENLCRDEGASLVLVTHDNRLKTRFAKTMNL